MAILFFAGRFKATDKANEPIGGAFLAFYSTLTSTFQPIYTDSTLSTVLPNPVQADTNGLMPEIWGDDSLDPYKVVFSSPDVSNISIPGSIIWTILQYNTVFTADALAELIIPLLNPLTDAEKAANVTVVNFSYPELTVDRYGTNTVAGSTDMVPAIKAAWNVAKRRGAGVIKFLKDATYALTTVDAATPVNLAAPRSDGTVTTQSFIAQVYCLGGSNVTFDFNGAQLKSTVTGLSVGSGCGILFDNCQNIRLISPNMTGTQVQTTGVVALGPVIAGSGYVSGTYNNVLMSGGTGNGCCCTIVVSGGAVSSVTPTYPGGGFVVGDTITTSNTNLGGSGSGFSVPVTNVTGAGNIVGTAGVVAFAVTSLSGPSSRITTHDLTSTNCFLGFWAVDNPNGTITTSISLLGHTTVINAEYGVALHNSGDDTFIENLNTFAVNRPYFFYGCQNVVLAQLDAVSTNYGFGSIIKSYSRSTRNITVNQSYRNALGNPTSRLAIQVQCDPAVFPTPPTVKNIYITHDEQNLLAGSNSIEFDFFSGSGGLVQTATSSMPLFDQIAIRGYGQGSIFSTVALTTTAAQCAINYDNFESTWSSILGSGQDIRTGLGFIASRQFFITCSLTFGGTTVAGAATTCQCTIADGLCKIQGITNVTAKNGTGQAAIILPFASRLDATTFSLATALAIGTWSSLGGTIVGVLSTNSNVMKLYTQGATGPVNVVDTNFTTSSSLYFDITYAI